MTTPEPYVSYASEREAVHEQVVDGFGPVRGLPLDPDTDAGTVPAG